MKVKIHVTLEQGILDAQGKAIEAVPGSKEYEHKKSVRLRGWS